MWESWMVIVVGAGIVGMSVAAELGQRGYDVTVIDRGEVGFGCSYGNAGWMTPCFSMPLPMPGMFLKSISWLLDPESPLYIKPTPSWLLMRWLTRFLLSMNEKQALAAVAGLTEISKYSLDYYKKLNTLYPNQFGMDRQGLLMVAQSKGGVKSCEAEMNFVATHGVPGRMMSPDEIKQFEPALTGKLEGGVYFPEEAHAEPLKVVQTLAQEAKKHGVKILEKVEVLNFEIENNKITSLMTSIGPMKAGQYVLATGSWSTHLAKKIGINVPILGGKGYSIITKPLTPQPTHPIMCLEKKIAITPRNGTLRIAGTLELVNQDFQVTDRRVKAIIKGSRQFINTPETLEIQELWRGLRPCTPDGVPMLGYSRKISNLMLSCGHQMLGLQSAPGSARVVCDLLDGKSTITDTRIFDPNRF